MQRIDYYFRDVAFLTRWNTPHQIAYNISVSTRHRYIFYETPKVACSTIKRLLMLNEGYWHLVHDEVSAKPDQFDQLHLREFSPLLNPKQLYPFRPLIEGTEFFKFCFVRNPYSRLLSAYLDKIVNKREQLRQIKQVLGRPMFPDQPVSFAEFIHAVADTPVTMMDPHWKVQYNHLEGDSIAFDFIGRFENLDADMAEVGRRVGLDMTHYRDHSPHRSGADNKVEDYYTDELRALVYKVYEADFETFGYSR